MGVLSGFSSICFQDQLLSPRLEAILGVIYKDPMPRGEKRNYKSRTRLHMGVGQGWNSGGVRQEVRGKGGEG